MKVTPILTNKVSPVSGLVNFKSKENGDLPVQYNHSSNPSYLKRVPVIVLIAMSPLTTTNTDAKIPFEPETPVTEVIEPQQSRRVHSTLTKKDLIKNGYETMQFLQIDSDNDKNTAETLGANYSYLSEGGNKGIMNMYVNMISLKPDKNGRYVIAYTEINNDRTLNDTRVCSVQAPFGKYILNFARSSANNNAIILERNGKLNQMYNGNIPWMEDEVTILYNEKTNTAYKVPRVNSKH